MATHICESHEAAIELAETLAVEEDRTWFLKRLAEIELEDGGPGVLMVETIVGNNKGTDRGVYILRRPASVRLMPLRQSRRKVEEVDIPVEDEGAE